MQSNARLSRKTNGETNPADGIGACMRNRHKAVIDDRCALLFAALQIRNKLVGIGNQVAGN